MRSASYFHKLGRAGVPVRLAGKNEFVGDGGYGLEEVGIIAGVRPNKVAAILEPKLARGSPGLGR